MSNRFRSSMLGTAFFAAGIAGQVLLGQSAPAIPVAQEFERLHFRSIGPAVNSGRISDLAVYEANPSIYYVGSAHGGVWKTTSNGFLFTPLLQDKGLMSIGAVTVSQANPNLVWVGTGEANNRQSTSWGDGIYKSTDGGTTFQHMGLGSSKHINRIVIDPLNNDVVLVAAPGPLFGPGGERGVYKTTDGGRTWKQVLKGDDDTGANELVMSHTDPKILFASLYQRRRTACCMNGGGPGSGIWKSTDGGDTWTKLAGGLPTGSLGRIALDVYRENSNIVYALIEGGGGGGLVAAGGGGRGGAPGVTQAGDTLAGRGRGRGGVDAGATGLYRSDDGGASWRKVTSVNPRPMYFSQVRIDPRNPERLFMGGTGLHMSIDGGRTFETNADQVIHSDHHAIWLDPNTPGHLMVGNDGGIAVSYDLARTWAFPPNLPVGLFYHVGYDMEIPFNVCGGMQDNYNWCGPSVSRHTHGIMNYDWIEIEGGDGFVVIPDLRDSRIVYSEAQDGNMIRRNKVTGEGKSIRPSAVNVTPAPARGETYRFNWDTPLMFSPHDPGTLLTAANKVFKSTDRGDSWTVISPDLTTNANRDDIVTMGLKNSETTVSRNDGVSAWPTITAMAESPKQAGLYYTGTDDGVVSVSRDGGKTWQNVTKNLPGFPTGHAYVSKVVPSRFDAGTVYITVDNHRLNDYEPHIWASSDFGASFRSINANLRGENVHTLTEDQKNPDVLYIGTESGIFLTLDRGKSWRRLKANFPNVRVDEITLHPRENAMIVASHGRNLWILDHLEPIQEYTAAQAAAADAKLFSVPTALEWKVMDNRNDEFWGHQYFVGENPPIEAVIQFHLKRPVNDLRLSFTDGSGKKVRDVVVPANRNQAGIQTVCWDMRIEPNPADTGAAGGRGGGRGGPPAVPGIPQPEPAVGYLASNPCGDEAGVGTAGFGVGGPAHLGPYVMPGTYSVALVAGGRTLDTRSMKIIMDPAVSLADAERRRYDALVTGLHDVQRLGTQAAAALNALYPQLTAATAKMKDAANVPATVKTQFDALAKEFDAVRVKFGVPVVVATGRGGGGGGGRGGADADNVLARTSALKVGVIAIWEPPTPAMVKQSTDARVALQQAVTEANAFLAKAATMSQSLKTYDVTLTVPPAIK
jgi:photosystem II stability/assembly factor-like uncharacterized protein